MQGLENIANIKVNLTIELGRIKITLKELLKMSGGSIIELGVSPNDPLKIYANGVLFGYGEVVTINDGKKLGIRIVSLENSNKPQGMSIK